MRPTPTKTRRPSSRSPRRRSSPHRTPNKNNPPSARRSLMKRGLGDSLGNSSFAETPVSKLQSSKRGRSPDASDNNRNSSSTINYNGDSSSSGDRPNKAHGKRAKMSPRTHGAAIAKSLTSPFIDSAFLMSTTAPITPSKRSSAELALNHVARNTKRGKNNTAAQLDEDKNINTSPYKKQKKKGPTLNAGSTDDSRLHQSEQGHDVELFVPKGKLEERWLKNFNKWKQSVEEQGIDDTTHRSPLPKTWINAQRREYKAMKQNEKTSMTQSKVDLLESAGFTWDAPTGRPKRTSCNSNNEEAAVIALVGVKSDASSIRRRNGNNDGNNDKSSEELSPSKRTSPRKSCPTQFYHNLLGKEESGGDDDHSNGNAAEQRKDNNQDKSKTTNTSVSNEQAIKESYKCRKCGKQKKGHICTMEKSDDDEKAVESLALLAASSDDAEHQPTKQKRQGKKRRSRGGRQGVSLLSSLETLHARNSSLTKKAVLPLSEKDESAKAKCAEEMEVNKSTASKKTKKFTSGYVTKQGKNLGSTVMGIDKATAPTEMIEREIVAVDDQPISPFPSSPLRTSNLECPESGSISVGQAQNSPAKKNVPESICIRELMMSCLTEEDKDEEKRCSKLEGLGLKATEQGRKDGNDDDEESTMNVDTPLPNTPIHNKETPLSTFSPLSMTSPLRANNLLETSYNDEPGIQDKSLPHGNNADSHPIHPEELRSASTTRRSNQTVKNLHNISTAAYAEIAQTSERIDEAKQLHLIQAEKQYQEKMAEFGKLELEARMVTERMRQIEERMRQIESSSISNDLREYDEMKRRASYPFHAETFRPSKRKMITSQRHYGSSEDDISDEYDSRRNWGQSHVRHGDREKITKLRKHETRSPSRSQSKRSNSRRRRIENTTRENGRLSVSRKQQKKGSKQKVDEAGRHSMSQMKRTSLKSPYALPQTDEARLRETRLSDSSSNAKVQKEEDASNVEDEANDTATYIESAKMPYQAREESKKDSDSSSTKQSSVEHVEKGNDAKHHSKTKERGKSKDPLYWLAGGESDSDEESWDFDGPMILPPPPA